MMEEKSKTANVSAEDLILFPRFNNDTLKGMALWETAYLEEQKFDQSGQGEYIVAAARGYLDAFEAGIVDAGANLLRILFKALVNSMMKKKSPAPISIYEKIFYVLNRLELLQHPGGRYYRALGLILDIFQGGSESVDDGWTMMQGLEETGNEFAVEFMRLARNG